MTENQTTENAAANDASEEKTDAKPEARQPSARKPRNRAGGRQSMTAERCEALGLSPSVYGLKASGKKKGRR